MKKYTVINDIENIPVTIAEALQLKQDPLAFSELGKNKTLIMLFLIPVYVRG